MQALSEKLTNIELKVRQLALRLERLENEKQRLLEDNKKLRTELVKKDNRLGQLEEKVAKSSAALELKRQNDPERSKKLRKEIEQYIREVDKCIAWLQNS